MRIGSGWDRHRLEQQSDSTLWLGGVAVHSDRYAVAHSDGDVLIHALIDALLGATALGDIGTLFPDTDPKYHNMSSMKLLEATKALLASKGYLPRQIDGTILLESPKLAPYKEAIRNSLAEALGIAPDWVSIKAKTGEGVGPVGKGAAIEALVTVVVSEADPTVWV